MCGVGSVSHRMPAELPPPQPPQDTADFIVIVSAIAPACSTAAPSATATILQPSTACMTWLTLMIQWAVELICRAWVPPTSSAPFPSSLALRCRWQTCCCAKRMPAAWRIAWRHSTSPMLRRHQQIRAAPCLLASAPRPHPCPSRLSPASVSCQAPI